MEKSITLRKHILEKSIYDAINSSGIPICFVDDILKGIYNACHNAAKKELLEELQKAGDCNASSE